MSDAPAGWYPHSTQPGLELYWDGKAWTDQRTMAPPASPISAPIVVSAETQRMPGQTLPTPVLVAICVFLGLFLAVVLLSLLA